LPGCCAQLFRASSWEGHKHLRTRRCEKSTKKRRLLCRKLPEVPVIVLQDYRIITVDNTDTKTFKLYFPVNNRELGDTREVFR